MLRDDVFCSGLVKNSRQIYLREDKVLLAGMQRALWWYATKSSGLLRICFFPEWYQMDIIRCFTIFIISVAQYCHCCYAQSWKAVRRNLHLVSVRRESKRYNILDVCKGVWLLARFSKSVENKLHDYLYETTLHSSVNWSYLMRFIFHGRGELRAQIEPWGVSIDQLAESSLFLQLNIYFRNIWMAVW